MGAPVCSRIGNDTFWLSLAIIMPLALTAQTVPDQPHFGSKPDQFPWRDA